MSKSLMQPETAIIEAIQPLTWDTLLFDVRLMGKGSGGKKKVFKYIPGQFAEISVFGVGECPISITSTPTRKGPLQFAIRETGQVTRALHNLEPGNMIGLRWPLGNSFPVEEMKGSDIYFIAGGIGLAPLRSLINYVLDRRNDYGKIDIVYGARTPELLCFSREFETWRNSRDTRLHLTVDTEATGWRGKVGFVPAIVRELGLPAKNRVAVACGPPVMIKYVLADLSIAGYRDDQVITTLELKMKCGVGKCGRCNIGPMYVCKDGPVFRLSELSELPAEY
jgi:NAD(P)H-flavin reductase